MVMERKVPVTHWKTSVYSK